MSNTVLRKLEDIKKRKFPLIYKYIEEEINPAGSQYAGWVYVSHHKDSRLNCIHYHKPISKLFR